MATVAAVVAAGATVAAGAYSATQSGGGKGGGGAPTMAGMSPWERIFNRGTADMNDEERRVMEDALAQQNFMNPELYKLLGYEPVYDDRGASPEALKALGDQVDKATQAARAAQETIDSGKGDLRDLQKQLKGLKGKKNRDARQQVQQQITDTKKAMAAAKSQRVPLMNQAADLQRQLSDAQTMPRRVVGVKPLDHPADPTQSNGDLYRMAFDLQNQALVSALKGEAPVDATLKTQWDQKEQDLRERLRRQLGSDYETTTAGEQALALFDRQRNDAFSSYNTQIIGQLSQETESRAASLSNLTSQRMQQLLYPSRAQQASALALGQAASDRNAVAGLFQHERTAQYEGKANAYAQDTANANARAQAISALIGSAGQGIGAAGGSLGSYLGGNAGVAKPDTVTVPSY